ncbi:Galacturonosyltransferase 8 [Glycine soja]
MADSNGGVESIRRSIIALKTDPLKPRLEQIRKQADDHGSLARVCFLCTQAQAGELKACKDFRGAMWQLGGSYEQTSIQASFQQSVLRQVVGDAKESFDNQLKTQKLKDTIFAVNEQLTKAKKQGANSKELALSLHERGLPILRSIQMMESLPEDPKLHGMFWDFGYNPSISMDEIRNAAVVHFNGNMKPWLDIAMIQATLVEVC